MRASELDPQAGIRGPAGFIVRALAVAMVLALDAVVAWGLYGVGLHGLRAIGGWGMLMVGIVLTVTAAANLLLLLVFVYRAAARRADAIGGQSR